MNFTERHIGPSSADQRSMLQVLGYDSLDDLTAAGSGQPGHGADLTAALAGLPSEVPVVLLAHQPKQVGAAVLQFGA